MVTTEADDENAPPHRTHPTAQMSRWHSLAEHALRGKPLDTLTRATPDGIVRGPLFTAQDAPDVLPTIARHPVRSGMTTPFDIRSLVQAQSPDEANPIALDELEGGATGLVLIQDPTGVYGCDLANPSDLAQALDGVWLNGASVSLGAWKEVPGSRQSHSQAANALLDLWTASPHPAEQLSGALNLDPLGAALVEGDDASTDELTQAQADTIAVLTRALSHPADITVIGIDGCVAHELGAEPVLELAWVAAATKHALALGAGHGVPIDAAARALQLHLAASQDIHLTIAKFRAARLIYARIVAAFGGSADAQIPRVEAWTSGRMMQAQDAWTNQIRTSCAVFAAAAGGADAIVTLPFTAPLGKPTPKARRLARNQVLIAAQESHLGAVPDPAAGSFTHEALTDRLARAGWEKFQQVEAQGGATDYARSGALKQDFSIDTAAHAANDPTIIGVTHYADNTVPAPEVLG